MPPARAAAIAHLVLRSEMGPGGGAPAVLLVCPPPGRPVRRGRGALSDRKRSARALPREFARVAAALRRPWLDAGAVIVTSALDGWHLEASQHELLGVAVAAKVRDLLE